jgi:hypothetical protein
MAVWILVGLLADPEATRACLAEPASDVTAGTVVIDTTRRRRSSARDVNPQRASRASS